MFAGDSGGSGGGVVRRWGRAGRGAGEGSVRSNKSTRQESGDGGCKRKGQGEEARGEERGSECSKIARERGVEVRHSSTA